MGDFKNFDWTMIGTIPEAHKVIWAVECELCRERTPTPDVEKLSRADQDDLIKKIAERHVCKGR